ncbi:MAG: GNAT family N-acetyltransferase [Aureliella sp.]
MNFFGEANPHGAGGSGGSKEREAVATVAPDRWEEFIRWIDPLRDAGEVRAALEEFQRRFQLKSSSPLPLEFCVGERRVAGAYMMLLGARVAAVAGVRAVEGQTLRGVDLLNRLVGEVRAHGVVQIQAILDGTDSVATEIVQLAGFVPLAELQQVVLMLPKAHGEPAADADRPAVSLPENLEWVAAKDMPQEKLTQLLAHTFIETLDCPALNGLRTPEDVLEGFLDGQPLQSRSGWWVLVSQGKAIGCVLINLLPSRAAELVYMGLGPTSRGRGYGKLLLEQGIASAKALGGEMFIAAVDCANWPAIRLYHQVGFQEHARVQAWFYRPQA